MDTKTLIERVAADAAIDSADASALLASLCDIVATRCSEMDTVALPGFGSFEPRKRLERVMVMPSTGKRMLLPPKVVLSFKPSAVLKQSLRNVK